MFPTKKMIELKEVLFESNDNEVLIRGEVQKNHMRFNTEIIISHTQLNQLLSELKKLNNYFDFSNIFRSE